MKLNIGFVAAAAAASAALTAHALPTSRDSQLIVRRADLKLDGALKLQAVQRGTDTELDIRRLDHDGERADAILARDTGEPKDELLVSRGLLGLVRDSKPVEELSDDQKLAQNIKDHEGYLKSMEDRIAEYDKLHPYYSYYGGRTRDDEKPRQDLIKQKALIESALADLRTGTYDRHLMSEFEPAHARKLDKLKAKVNVVQSKIDGARELIALSPDYKPTPAKALKNIKMWEEKKAGYAKKVLDHVLVGEELHSKLREDEKRFEEVKREWWAGKGKAPLDDAASLVGTSSSDGAASLHGASSLHEPLLNAGKNSA